MRTFTQEEQDYILKTLADPANDTYIARAVVKNAQELATRTKREANLKKATSLIVNALTVNLKISGLDSFHEFPLAPMGDEKRIDMYTSYGVYTIMLREKV